MPKGCCHPASEALARPPTSSKAVLVPVNANWAVRLNSISSMHWPPLMKIPLGQLSLSTRGMPIVSAPLRPKVTVEPALRICRSRLAPRTYSPSPEAERPGSSTVSEVVVPPNAGMRPVTFSGSVASRPISDSASVIASGSSMAAASETPWSSSRSKSQSGAASGQSTPAKYWRVGSSRSPEGLAKSAVLTTTERSGSVGSGATVPTRSLRLSSPVGRAATTRPSGLLRTSMVAPIEVPPSTTLAVPVAETVRLFGVVEPSTPTCRARSDRRTSTSSGSPETSAPTRSARSTALMVPSSEASRVAETAPAVFSRVISIVPVTESGASPTVTAALSEPATPSDEITAVSAAESRVSQSAPNGASTVPSSRASSTASPPPAGLVTVSEASTSSAVSPMVAVASPLTATVRSPAGLLARSRVQTVPSSSHSGIDAGLVPPRVAWSAKPVGAGAPSSRASSLVDRVPSMRA